MLKIILTICCVLVAFTICGIKKGTITPKKAILTICLIVLAILIVFVSVYLAGRYYHDWMITNIAEYESPDGEYTLVVQQIGHPLLTEAETFRAVLKKGKVIVDEGKFYCSFLGDWNSVADVTWGDEAVTVYYLDNVKATLYYDGSELTINYD